MDVFNPNNTQEKKNLCPDVYPCILTDTISNKCWTGCNSSISDSNSCNDCLWMCFPFTVVIDTITAIPFACIYGVNKKC